MLIKSPNDRYVDAVLVDENQAVSIGDQLFQLSIDEELRRA